MSTETILAEAVSNANDEAALASDMFGEPQEAQPDEAAEPVQDQPQDTQADTEPEEAESSIEDFDDFISKNELDPEAMYDLKFKLKIDGKEEVTTLRDLIKVNQLEGHVNRKSIELSEQKKAWDAQETKLREDWQQRIGMASTSLDTQEAQLQQQFQQVPWDQLYQTSPAEYSALQLRFQQAYQMIQGQKQQLATHVQQTRQQYREQLVPKYQEAVRAQHPDLADSASYSNALAEMKSYLKERGADERNYEALELDPLVFTVVRDAMRYRSIANKQPQVANKVKTAPKLESPTSRTSVGKQQAHMNDLQRRANAGDENAIAEMFLRS